MVLAAKVMRINMGERFIHENRGVRVQSLPQNFAWQRLRMVLANAAQRSQLPPEAYATASLRR